MAAIIGFTSCSDDDDDDAIGPALDINVIGETTVPPGSTIVVTWESWDGDAKLDYFTILEGNTAVQGWDQKEIPRDQNQTYNDTAYLQAPATDGNSTTFTFTVTDKDGLTDSKNITITAEAPATGTSISTFTDITLGDIAYNTTTDGYLDVSTETTYAYNASGAENSDIGYLFGNSYPKCIFAPDFSEVQGLSQGPSGFSTQRATRFSETTLSASDFDAIGASLDSDDVIEDNVSSPSATYIKDLSTGDVIGFVTADDNKGLIKVVTIGGAYKETDNTITIDVKVQQ